VSSLVKGVGTRHGGCLVALAAVLVTLLTATPSQAAPADPLFLWSMAPNFEPDAAGRLRPTQPGSVGDGPWRVNLSVEQALCSPRGRYRWTIDGKRATLRKGVGCEFTWPAKTQGPHTVRLQVKLGPLRLEHTERVTVRDLLIVSIGDSIGSGEGAPDAPGLNRAEWNSERCHRSGRASPSLTAARIERDDPHTSVTFVHLACSGAGIETGVLSKYEGAEPPPNEDKLESQINDLRTVARQRRIDALIVNVGANDAHFADVVKMCAAPGEGSCFDRRFDPERRATTGEVVQEDLSRLPGLYGQLAAALPGKRRLAPSHVHIVQYEDPMTDEHGTTCESSLGFTTANDLRRARTQLLAPLNGHIAATHDRFGWDVVTGAAQSFRGHGYCAGDQAWMRRVEESIFSQGGDPTGGGRILGTFHPNYRGQQAFADLVAPQVERSLFGRVIPQPRRDTGDEGRTESKVLAIVIGALSGLLVVLLIGWLARRRYAWILRVWPLFALAGIAAVVCAFAIDLETNVARDLAATGGALVALAIVLWRLRVPSEGQTPAHRRRVALWSVVAIAAVLAGGLIWFEHLRAAFLVLGLAGGGALALYMTYREASMPPSLRRTFAPLALPLLAIAAVGTLKLSIAVTLIAGVYVGVLAGHFIVRPELRRAEGELEWVLESGKELAVLALVVALVAGAVSKGASPDAAPLENRGTVSVALLLAAEVLLGLTLVARLVSYAATRLRVIIAIALGVLVIRGLMWLGIFPGHDWLRSDGPGLDAILLIACAVALLAAAVAAAVSHRLFGRLNEPREKAPCLWRLTRAPLGGRHSPRAAGIGLGTALLAAVTIGAATVASLVETTDADVANPPGGANLTAESPAGTISKDDGVLAATYAPVLAFTDRERWKPIRVEDYLSNGAVMRRAGTAPGAADQEPRTLKDLEQTCPGAPATHGPRRACWQLTINCEKGEDDCADGHDETRDFVRDGAAYVRVIRRHPTPEQEKRFKKRGDDDGSAAVFGTLPGPVDDTGLEALIQYWFYYRYDEWRTPIVGGTLAQRHEADWEAVMVGVAEDRPLFVAYSAHCGGEWRYWEDVRVAPISSPRTHPLVAVAEGSHANYAKAGPRTPNWTSCSGIGDGVADALTYAANVRERTDYAWRWYPDRLIPAWRTKQPMSFPGRWGMNDRTVFESLSHHPIKEKEQSRAQGPKSPPLQNLYRSPIRTVFCNPHWRGPTNLCAGG
jgi:lysophospholipase L1-like esterase